MGLGHLLHHNPAPGTGPGNVAADADSIQVSGAVGGLENPERFALVCDLDRFASPGHALHFERLADQRAQRDRLHRVRH